MSISSISNLLTKNNFKLLHIGVVIISSLALTIAYFVEYYLHIPPCPLCVYQRFPYFSLIKISLTALLINKISKYSLLLIIFTLIIACILAGYHTAIERHLLEASNFCSATIKIPDHLSISEVKNLLYNKPTANCSRAAYKILGFSMAELNFLLNLALLIIIGSITSSSWRTYAKTKF